MLSRITGHTIPDQGVFYPKSHRAFWAEKFARNVANDRKHVRRLRRLGWRVIVVWECQLKNPGRVLARIERRR